MGALSMKERIAAARAGIASNRTKGVRPYKFKVGTTLFRILPDKDASADWWRYFAQLYLKSFDGKDFVVVGDRQVTYGEEDPLREMVFDGMKNAPSADIKDHFKEMLGGTRALFQALILNDNEVDKKTPQLVEVSEGAFDDILAQFQMYLDIDENHDLASLARGHVFRCDRVGTGKNDTKYTFLATPQPAPLRADILDSAHDLDGWVKSLFEAKEQKALGVLAKLGVNVGAGSVAAALTNGTKPQAALPPASTTPAPAQGVSPAAVTTVIEDAEVTEIDPAILAGLSSDPVAPVTTPAPVQQAPAQSAPVQTAPVQPAATTTPVDPTDIEAILATLN